MSRKNPAALVRDYQAVFGSPIGIKVLHNLMETHGVLRSVWSEDTGKMAFLEGQRSVVLRIMGIIKTNPAEMEKRMEEYVSSNQSAV
jgi:hypothetical protein